MNGCDPKVTGKELMIPSRVNENRIRAENVFSDANRLRDRLAKVLRPEGLQEKCAAESPILAVPLAADVEEATKTIIKASAVIEDIISRLEV